MEDRDRQLYYAGAPYQFYAMALLREELYADVPADLVLMDQFGHALEMARRAKEQGLFENVWVLKPGPWMSATVPQQLALLGKSLLKMHNEFAEQYPETAAGLERERYTRFFFSIANRLTFGLKQLISRNGPVPSTLVEDGSGTFNGAIADAVFMLDPIWRRERGQNMDSDSEAAELFVAGRGMVKSLVDALSRGRLRMGVDELRVFNPEAPEVAQSFQNLSVKGVPTTPGSRVAEVFNAGAIAGGTPANVFFLSPEGESSPLDEEARSVVALIEEGRLNDGLPWLIRRHPRSLDTGFLDANARNYRQDDSWSWEIEAASGLVTDESVLMAFGSSALFVPHELFGKKPALVYLYRLLPEGSRFKNAFKNECERAKQAYGGGRVYDPATVEELEALVGELGAR